MADRGFHRNKGPELPAVPHDHHKRKQFPKQWVSSCGCVHNTYTGEDINAGGFCGCICGEGHIHLTQVEK